MASLNQCNFIGNMGADPDVRYSAGGAAVTSISIACTETWKDKDGEKQDRTEWVKVTAFGKLAEIMGEYLKKGSKVYISGRMQTDKWTDKEGVDRYTTKIIANQMIMLDSKGAESRRPSEQAQEKEARPAEREAFVDDDINF